MSKKSRRRNKKILAVLGLAGAAVAASRRNKGTAADVDSGRGGDSSSAAARVAANAVTGTKYPGENKVKPIVDTQPKKVVLGNTRLSRDGVTPGTGRKDTVVTNVTRPGENMYSTNAGTSNPRRVNRKSGGRATYKSGGIAKRGISPILLKGKR
jgi:hypothetical protein